MHKKPLILLGGGGHCKSCIDVIESIGEWEIKGILDNNFNEDERVFGYPVIGDDSYIDSLNESHHYFLVTVGHIKSSAIRNHLFNLLEQKKANIATIISPNAYVSKYAKVAQGTIVHHGCIINANVEIGENNIINSSAIIEHDTVIGNHNHISTAVTINGNVYLGNNCFIGSGSVVSNNLRISDGVVIGAGSLVIKNIDKAGVYAGSPIKLMINE
jgi:sugar O-acyltransferase (sialic acid O-acetyltransferase NeuD family)